MVALISNTIYQNHLDAQQREVKIAAYELKVSNYLKAGDKCTPFEAIPEINYLTNTRSNQRWESVVEQFTSIRSAKCFLDVDKAIHTNPYRNFSFDGIATADVGTIQYEIWQGMLYGYDLGMPFLRTGGSICADGSYSPSVGRGTCSWHGGYGSRRGELFDFSFSESTYDPRPRLAELKSD